MAPPGLRVKVDRRARRISLRVDVRGHATLVLPHEGLRAEGLRFAAKQQCWLDQQLAKQPGRVPFAPGESVPVAGAAHRIEHAPDSPDPVRMADGRLTVAGPADGVSSLVEGWLREEARRALTAAAAEYAAAIGQPMPNVAVRDSMTRWGSCSARTGLSFSWRLAMVPADVLRYVAAHEVAHLVVPNHSARFWAVVERLYPGYDLPHHWLKRGGRELYRYG